MRPYRLIGLMIVCLASIRTNTASAHPRKIHYHGGVCQYGGVVSGQTGTPGLAYSGLKGAAATGANVTAVCPLDYVLFDTDTSNGPVWVTVWVSAQTPSSSSAGSFCDLQIDQPSWGDIPMTAFPAPGTSGKPWGSLQVQVPSVTTDPTGVRVVCTLMNGVSIGAIEMKVED